MRASPFSTGIVNTSPRALASTRWPVALSDTSSMSLAHVLPARGRPRHVASGGDRQRAHVARGGIDGVQTPLALDDEGVRTGAHRFHVGAGEPRELAQRARGRRVGPDVAHPVAIAEEVDRVAHPDRLDVGRALRVGNLGLLQRLDVQDAQRRVLAAAVGAPLAVPPRHAVHDHALAIGGVAAVRAPRRGKHGARPARGCDGPQPVVAGRGGLAGRRVEHSGAVAGPASGAGGLAGYHVRRVGSPPEAGTV